MTDPAVSLDPAYDGLDPDDADVTNTDDDVLREWTLLFYMVADGQHEAGAINDINHMERAIDSTDINLVVQLDRADGDDTSNGDRTDTRRFFIEPDPSSDRVIRSTEIAVLGEVDMGDPTSLADFISWGGQAYPAKRLGVLVWGGATPLTIGLDFSHSDPPGMGADPIWSMLGEVTEALAAFGKIENASDQDHLRKRRPTLRHSTAMP